MTPEPPGGGLFAGAGPAIKGASTVPAYALVFINLLIVLAVATQVRLALAIVVVVLVGVLSAFAIWVVEVRSRRAVSTTSPGQTERLREVRDLDDPIRGVFEELVGEDDVYVVYSSTEVREFVDQRGVVVRHADPHRPDDPAYGGTAEKRVTTIPDAIGAGGLYNLLYLGGKRDRLHAITSWEGDFRPEFWDKSMILLGSGRSNCATSEALDGFNSPFRFSEDAAAIVEVAAPHDRWPLDQADLTTTDYAVVVKLKVQDAESTKIYLVIAGVGPQGTLAGCRFLQREIKGVYEEHGSSPFAYVLSVRRDGIKQRDAKVERSVALPVVRRRER